jgi:hypothetical protein
MEDESMSVQPVYVTDSEVATVLSACRVLVAVSTRAGAGRREALDLMLRRIPAPRRLELVAVLREFAAAGAGADDGPPG